MGSDSDLPVIQEAAKVLKQFEIAYEIGVYSAHRSPHRTLEYVKSARQRGLKVIIAGAGSSAHLAGVTAADRRHAGQEIICTRCLVIGRGPRSRRRGVNSDEGPTRLRRAGSGATNAGMFAVQILALNDEKLARKLAEYKDQLEKSVADKNKQVQQGQL